MTCTSERSGMASSDVWYTAHRPLPIIAAISRTTRKRLRALNSMRRAIMTLVLARVRPSVFHLGVIHAFHTFHAALFIVHAFHPFHTSHVHAGHAASEAQTALGINKKIGRGHDLLARLQAFQNLKPAAFLALRGLELELADLDRHGYELAWPDHPVGDVALSGAHDRRGWNQQPLAHRVLNDYLREHAGFESAVQVRQLDPDLGGPRRSLPGRLDQC